MPRPTALHQDASAPRASGRLAWALGAGAALLLFLLASTWTAPGSPPTAWSALRELGAAGPFAAAWILMAFGLGWPLRRWLAPRDASSAALQVGLGTALTLGVLNALATLGLLGTATSWGLLVIGAVLGIVCLLRDRPAAHATGAIAAAAGPAVGVLVLAALSAPGWLWSTEFGGYDALSYHLQLPKEWLLEGRLRPAEHCVYAFLPGFAETAYLQLMALRGGGPDAALSAATSCQMLHALITVLSAWCAGQAAAAWWLTARGRPTEGCARDTGAVAAGVSAALLLCTPWSVVVGSLAYNEMIVVLLLACGMLAVAPGAQALHERDTGPHHDSAVVARCWLRPSLVVGLLAGAACGAKLTAAAFAALPLGVLLLWSVTPRRWLPSALTCVGLAVLLLGPWLARNALATGNPLFPFATSLLGTGHWSAEQADLFARGHGSELGLGSRLLRLWQQWLVFGLGVNPEPGEPWQPQWSVAPWLAILGIAALAMPWPRRDSRVLHGARRIALRLGVVLAIQLVAWLLATHLQSRFLLPTLVPAALIAGVAAGRWADALRPLAPLEDAAVRRPSRPPAAARCDPRGPVGWLAGAAILALSLLPASVLLRERGGAPSQAIGEARFLAGDGPPGSGVEEMPAHWLNHRLPPGSRVLLVGDARPFWYLGEPIDYAWTTTWDRGPMSAVLAAHPGDVGAQRRALMRPNAGRGFTHLLIDPAMLERWRSSGWADPNLSAESLRPLLDAPNRVLKRFPGGGVLVELAG